MSPPDTPARAAPPAPDATADASDTPSELPAGSWFDPAAVLRPAELPDEIGRLGKFRVLKLLGHGGMGAVLAAEDAQLRRRVALKVMRPDLMARPEARERFLREARTAATVEHDHVVPVYEVGDDGGVLYIAMPLLAGESLDDRLRRDGRLAVGDALRVGAEVADGLAAAHAAGLVHRDIKPANLWMEGAAAGAFRRVKILDFGLARVVHEDTHLTTAGGVLGTPAYMSPEQAGGVEVDHRTDLFSLGAVLYRTLTGRLPFAGPSVMAILSALANKTPDPLRTLNPDVPPDLAALVDRLLAKTPAARPASAADVAAELTRMRAVRAELSRTDTVTLTAAPKPRRRRWAALLAGLLGLAAAAGVGVVVVRVKAPDGKETEVSAPSGSKIAVDATGTVTVTLPGATVPVAPMPRAVDPPEPECVLTAGTGSVEGLVVLPDNDTVVGGYDEGFVRVWSISARKLLREFRANPVRTLALHPDGKTVAVHTYAGELLTWDATTGRVVRRYESPPSGPAVSAYAIDFTPDGTGLVVSSDTARTVSVVDVAGGWHRVLDRFPPAATSANPRVRPDGAAVAVAAAGIPLRVLDLADGRVVAEAAHPAPNAAPAFSADGRRVYYHRGGGLIAGWEPGAAAAARHFVVPTRAAVWSLALNRSNTLLAAAGGGPDVHVWSTAGSPRPTRVLPGVGTTRWALRVAFTPDGTRLVSSHDGGTICVYRVSPGWAEPRPAYPPLDPAWLARVTALPADEQVRAVSAELVRRNPGFDGAVETNHRDGRLWRVRVATNQVDDISPLRALPHLTHVGLHGQPGTGRLWDLSPLAGMALVEVWVQDNPAWDIGPLKGMHLRRLMLDGSAVGDLGPVAGMTTLDYLSLTACPVRDLTPVAGLRLRDTLFLYNCVGVTDLGPLRTCTIRRLVLPPEFRGDLSPLAGTKLEQLEGDNFRPTPEQRRALEAIPTLRTICGKPAVEFWRDFDAAPKKE